MCICTCIFKSITALALFWDVCISKPAFHFPANRLMRLTYVWCTCNAKEIHYFSNAALLSNFQHFQVTVEFFFFFFSAVCFTRLGLLLGSRVLYQWRQMSKQSAFSTFFSFPFLLIRYKAALRAYPPLGNLKVSHSFTHKWWTISWH